MGTLVEAREGHVSINYGEYIYTCGGQQNSKIISSCEKFDLQTYVSRAILTSLQKGRRSAASIVSGDKEEFEIERFFFWHSDLSRFENIFSIWNKVAYFWWSTEDGIYQERDFLK